MLFISVIESANGRTDGQTCLLSLPIRFQRNAVVSEPRICRQAFPFILRPALVSNLIGFFLNYVFKDVLQKIKYIVAIFFLGSVPGAAARRTPLYRTRMGGTEL
jgi:hypothetical protein